MVVPMMVNGLKMSNRATALIKHLTVLRIKEHLKMTKSMEPEFKYGQMAANTKASGNLEDQNTASKMNFTLMSLARRKKEKAARLTMTKKIRYRKYGKHLNRMVSKCQY